MHGVMQATINHHNASKTYNTRDTVRQSGLAKDEIKLLKLVMSIKR